MQPKFIMNAATFRTRWGLKEFLYGCAARRIGRASIWGEDVKKVGLQSAVSLLKDCGVRAFGYNRAGPFLASDPKFRRDRLSQAKKEIDDAVAVGADHILVFPGGLEPGSRDLLGARRQTVDAIGQLLEHATGAGIALAIEPLHPMLCGDRTCITTVRHANEICAQFAGDGIGVAIDAYHVWWDETVADEIAKAGRENRILCFHVSDWLVPTTHILTDRGMMGDGIIDLTGIRELVRQAGYAGPIEVEIFSERWWKEDPDAVFDLALKRCGEIFLTHEQTNGPG